MDSFLTYILPVFACQYSMGVLVQLRGTQLYRGALLPILLWFAWRASVTVDPSGGDPTQVQLNAFLIGQMCSVAMRSAVWATAQEPYRRIDGSIPPGSYQGDEYKGLSANIATALWNAWDLLLNLRGVGWNWPRGLAFPKAAFETRSRVTFVLWSAVRLVFHVVAYDATLQAIRMFSPEDFSSAGHGGSIYEASLPPILQLIRCFMISAFTVLMTYFALEWCYQLLTILFVTLLQQHPSQWPPLFDSPWLSTSLSDLWGRRWHQMFRHMLLTIGSLPFDFLFGRLGGIIGAFLVSGIFHDIELRSVGRGGNSLVVIGFFVMNGVGIVLERVWKRICGRSVRGIWGWIWTFSWLALWGVPVVNEWGKAGRFGAESFGGFQPSVALISFVRRQI
ncbi:membrane bound O-acyl transferase family-domain-containing protein [Melanogaster broomeanus]|nr:membrane bound O-acyl transferase family-domain-containing protein [Melanogaster broomeanus]